MTPRQATGLVALAALWGASFIFIDIAVPAMGAIGMADSRALLAALMLALYGIATRQALRAGVALPLVVLTGAINVALPFALISAAQLTIPPSLAAIINATAPLFSAVFAALWLAERLTRRLGTSSYRDRNGRPKTVADFELTPVEGSFAPNDEVDELRWLAPDEAAALLTHEREREVVRALGT